MARTNQNIFWQLPFGVLSIACILGGLNGIGIHIAHLKEPGNAKYQSLGLMYFFLFEVFYCGSIIPSTIHDTTPLNLLYRTLD